MSRSSVWSLNAVQSCLSKRCWVLFLSAKSLSFWQLKVYLNNIEDHSTPNQKERPCSGSAPVLLVLWKPKQFLLSEKLWIQCFGTSKASCMSIFTRPKDHWYYHNKTTILLDSLESKCENGDKVKTKKIPIFCVLPAGQRAPSHYCFNSRNSRKSEVECATSPRLQPGLSSIGLSYLWTDERISWRQEIPNWRARGWCAKLDGSPTEKLLRKWVLIVTQTLARMY